MKKQIMIAAGVVVAAGLGYVLVRHIAGRKQAGAGAIGGSVTADQVQEAIPLQAGAMALSHWARSHVGDLGLSVPVGSGPVDRVEMGAAR